MDPKERRGRQCGHDGGLIGLVMGLEAWLLCAFCLLSDKRQERI